MLNKYEMTWTLDSDQSWRFSKKLDHVVTFSTAPGPGVRAKPDCQSSFRIGPVWVMSKVKGLGTNWTHIPVVTLWFHEISWGNESAMNLQSDFGLFGTTGCLHYGFWLSVFQGFQIQHQFAAEAQHVFCPLIDLAPRRNPKMVPPCNVRSS